MLGTNIPIVSSEYTWAPPVFWSLNVYLMVPIPLWKSQAGTVTLNQSFKKKFSTIILQGLYGKVSVHFVILFKENCNCSSGLTKLDVRFCI